MLSIDVSGLDLKHNFIMFCSIFFVFTWCVTKQINSLTPALTLNMMSIVLSWKSLVEDKL